MLILIISYFPKEIIMKKLLIIILCTVFLCSCESSMAKEKPYTLATDQYAVYDFIKTVFEGVTVTFTTDPLSESAKNADLFICIYSSVPQDNIYEIKKDVADADETMWISPEKAINAFYGIYGKIVSQNPGFADKYTEKYENYVIALQNLNTRYKNAVNDKPVLIANECNVSVLEKDYGFKTKVLKEKTGTVMDFVTTMKSKNISAVYYIRNMDTEPAEVTAKMTNSYCLPLDLCIVKDANAVKKCNKYPRILEYNIKNLEMR